VKPVKEWFWIGPYDEDEGYQYHWYNRCYEYSGTRIRFMAGDLMAGNEDENGCHAGPQFECALHIAQEDIHEFYLPDNPKAEYDVHTLTVIVWRWGIYLSVRGRIEVPA